MCRRRRPGRRWAASVPPRTRRGRSFAALPGSSRTDAATRAGARAAREPAAPTCRRARGRAAGPDGGPAGAPAAIRRDERERRRFGAGQRRRDDLGCDGCQAPQPVLLPAGDDAPDAIVVDQRRACGRERDPPSRALGAAIDGPRGRGAAALAERRHETRQRFEALAADCRARPPAGEASLREEQFEHVSRLRGSMWRDGAVCAPEARPNRSRSGPVPGGPPAGGSGCRPRAAACGRRCRPTRPGTDSRTPVLADAARR
jgi:hypothetical protein